VADIEGQKERLKAFVKYTGLPVYKFEARCGLSNGYISSMRRGIGYKALEQISETFPELNTAWLQTGQGEMLKGAGGSADPEPAAEAAPVEDPAGFVSIPAEAWNVIKQQAASLERKDRQVDRVISLLEAALNETKKTGAAVPSGSFAPSGTGPGLVVGTKHP
jgi:hypothetical protein